MRLMNKKVFLNSVSRKYILGYGIVILSLLIFLVANTLSNRYVSQTYANATAELMENDNLQNAVIDVNDAINMTYNFLDSEGFAKYDENKTRLQEMLEKREKYIGTEKAIREDVDLYYTIISYLNTCDDLMNKLRVYIGENEKPDTDNTSVKIKYDNVQELYSYSQLRFHDSYTVHLNAFSNMQENLELVQKTTTLIMIILLVGIVVICIAYTLTVIKDILNSIKRMMAGVNRLQENIFEEDDIVIESGDEFEELAHAFNRMSLIIRQQMRELEEAAKVKEKLDEAEKENLRIYGDLQKNHLDFLQSRINPHFLFNTLNMIISQARIEDADKTAELMETTAVFLRYNLDSITKTVTLEQEIKNLRDFISIEEYRYGERFKFEVQLDEDCKNQSMPCMILQPLLENSIQHGIGMMLEGGYVIIRIKLKNGRVIMETEDNGVGMTEQQILEMYTNLNENISDSKHIGIRNIYRRLQYFYANDVRLEITSLNPGLIVSISTPYQPFSENMNHNKQA